jgi:periplasmic protein TonB
MFSDTPALPRRLRLGLAAAIVLLHLVLGLMLVRAFGGVGALVDSVGRATGLVAIALPDQPPPPHPAPRAVQSRVAEGASGAAGARASADQVVAPPPRIVLPALAAAPVAGNGSETRSGASDSGAGTGGAGAGSGTGSGGAGNGAGGRYATTKPVKIAGDLAESDYAPAGRAKRLGTSVIVVLTVGTDGHVTACRVHQPSGDPDADAVTCRLAQDRFRFKPAVDQDGNPIEASYGWQQRFFWK